MIAGDRRPSFRARFSGETGPQVSGPAGFGVDVDELFFCGLAG